MDSCLDASWETFTAEARQAEKGIFLFGASSTGRMFLEQVAEKFRIRGILDNDSKKWGEVWLVSGKEIVVQGIQALKSAEKEDIVLVTSTWYLDILKQLEASGYQGKAYSFLSMRKVLGGGSLESSIKEFEEHFAEVESLLADEESVRILRAVLEKRKNADLNYSDIKSAGAYFLPDIIRKRKDAVYVDAGAFNGDTVKEFIAFQSQEYKKVFAFEMDRENYDAIEFDLFDGRVQFYPYGLWKEKGTYQFLSSQMASSLSDIGIQKTQVVTLDEIVRGESVTLIKMDIEGAEKEALQGAQATIRREKPDLAICVYHKPEDIWQIPLLLADMVNGYRFYLRHHGDTIMDTVLYAVYGGTIPYSTQSIDEEDIQAVTETLLSPYLTTGPKIEQFEHDVANYVGAKYAAAVANGTAALHAACYAAGIQPGDEVITSPLTFAASANCILYCGGKPVFADICSDTYNLDPDDIRRKITEKTKAVIAVDLAGQPCDLDAIRKVTDEYHLILIEDAAHALGAVYKGRKVGSVAEMTTFSFHPVKPVTTGEGGMVVTDDESLCRKIKLFRSHGITRDTEWMNETETASSDVCKKGPWYYEQLELGYNYRITDIQCALGCSQMKKLDSFLARRRELAEQYDRAFWDCPYVVTPYQMPGTESGWHLYMIQVVNCDRKKVFTMLRRKGIGVNVHYIPVYFHPYYRENGYRDVCCMNAEQVYKQLLSLPLYPGLTQKQQEYVVRCVKEAVCRS